MDESTGDQESSLELSELKTYTLLLFTVMVFVQISVSLVISGKL
jgi:hypothetical protein